jgi:hypothetical protein
MEDTASQIKKTKKTKQLAPSPSPSPSQAQSQAPSQGEEPVQEQKEIRLVDIPINDENIALNVIVGFLNVAHKRGAFTIDESAKIWECISKFQKP